MIWNLGTTTRLTKEEAIGDTAGRDRVEATKAWKTRSRLRRGSSGGGGEAMQPGLIEIVLVVAATALLRHISR